MKQAILAIALALALHQHADVLAAPPIGKVTGREEMALGTPAPSHAPLGEHSGVVLQAVTGVAEVDAGPPATITTVEGQISLSGITYGAALVGEHPNVQTLPVSLFQIGNVGPNHVLPRTAPFADSPPLFAGSGTVDLSALYLPALSASTYVAATTPADIGGAHTALLGTQFTTNAPGVSIFSVSGTCAVPAAVAAARTQLYVTVDSVPPRIGDGALFRTHVADARLLGTQFHCASTQFATVGAAGSHDLSVRGYSEHEDATASMVGVSHVHLPYAQLEAAALPIAIGLNGTGGGWEVALEEFFPLDAGSTAILALRGQVRRGSQSQQLQFRVRVGEAGSEHTLGAPVTVYTAASGVNVATSVELIRFFTLPAAATAGLRVLVEYTAASEIVLEQAALDLVSMRDSVFTDVQPPSNVHAHSGMGEVQATWEPASDSVVNQYIVMVVDKATGEELAEMTVPASARSALVSSVGFHRFVNVTVAAANVFDSASVTAKVTMMPEGSDATIEWFWNDMPIVGAHCADLVLPPLTESDAGTLKAVVTNKWGTRTTETQLVIDPAPKPTATPPNVFASRGETLTLTANMFGL